MMRRKGRIGKNGTLVIEGIFKICPFTVDSFCGDHCALFDAIEIKGKVVGAYLGCRNLKWIFIPEESK